MTLGGPGVYACLILSVGVNLSHRTLACSHSLLDAQLRLFTLLDPFLQHSFVPQCSHSFRFPFSFLFLFFFFGFALFPFSIIPYTF